MILFAISQTSTFRSWLREKVVTTVNGSINGRLSIDKIDGTIFTSLILRNTNLVHKQDTILTAEKIEIRTSPLKLLFKIIYFRNIQIENAKIKLLKDENGRLNISQLSKTSPEEIIDTTSTGSDFMFKYQVANFALKNVDFYLQDINHKGSQAVYDNMNLDDFIIDNLNLVLNAFVDLDGNEIMLNINEMSGHPNLTGFKLKSLRGNFLIEGAQAGITGLNIVTNRSKIYLNAAIKDFNLLSGEGKFETAQLKFDLSANDFNFDDISNFIPSTSLLKGNVKTALSAKGTLNNLTISRLDLAFNETTLKSSGEIKKIPAGAKMIIDLTFTGSAINQNDVQNLLPGINIPAYAGLGQLNVDTLKFTGNPVDFNAKMYIRTDMGSFNASTIMNLTGPNIVYDMKFNSSNLDAFPFTGIHTKLNSNLLFRGVGFSPEDMVSQLAFNANGSQIERRKYQVLNISMNANDGMLEYLLKFKSDTTKGRVSGNFNFTNAGDPAYSVNAQLNNFNLSDITENPKWESNLNLSLTADGDSFDPDSINLFTVMSIDSSSFGDIVLDNKKIIVDLRRDDGGKRVINLVSNLADLTMLGDYSIDDLGSIVKTESELITRFIKSEISHVRNTGDSSPNKEILFDLPADGMDIDYTVEFKDFEILSLFLNNADIEIDGDISGKLLREKDILSATLNLDVNYFRYWDGDELFYVSDLQLRAGLENDFSKSAPNDLTSDIHLSAHRLFINNKFNNLSLNTSLRKNKMSLSFYGELEDYLTANLSGNFNVTEDEIDLDLDTLRIRYEDYKLINDQPVNLYYANHEFHFRNFELLHPPGKINVDGFFSLQGNQNLALHIDNLKGDAISMEVLGLPKALSINSDINLSAFWQGTAQDPILNSSLTVDSIEIRGNKLGALTSSLDYSDKRLNMKVNFLDTLYNIQNPKLNVYGILPIDLSLESKQTLLMDDPLDITIEADKFNLVTMENIVPYVRNIRGQLSSGLKLEGTLNKINASGNLKVTNSSFVSALNNIRYQTALNLKFDNEKVEIDSFWVRNEDGVKDGGTIYGRGQIHHNNFAIDDISIYLNGSLKVLSRQTQAVNPNIYGNLTVQTIGDISYIKSKTQNELNANLLVNKGASVTFLPAGGGFTNSSDKFIYVYKDYSQKEEAVIDSLILLSHLRSKSKEVGPSSTNPLNVRLKIQVESEVKMVVVLSQEFQQNLTAYLGGNFEYDLIGDKPVAKGELNLLEGSKLEFIKPFQASGSVKFLSDIDDPYLNVSATYRDFYISSDTVATTGEREVEIRIKLEGPLSNLDKDFMQKSENVGVYIRNNSLADFQLDPSKTPSDAMMFIIVGRFTDDATSQDRNVAVSTATAFAGSLVGSYLNQTFGNYIRSVRIQKVGTETKFSLIGKAGPFRYEIGGTSRVFQDLSRANVKVEFPPITSLRALVLRLERKEPLQGTSTYNEMINEFGIRYRFNF